MRFLLAVFAWGLLSFAGFGAAQSFPANPVTLIVPFAAGGPTDGLARILAEPMKQSIGQPILVENVTGAGGTIRPTPPAARGRPPRCPWPRGGAAWAPRRCFRFRSMC